MKKPIVSNFDFASYSDKHQKAKEIDPHDYTYWSRNVIDEYKSLTDAEIKTKLQEKAKPFAFMFENWNHNLNIGVGLRNANGFGARECFYVGYKRWDRRSAVGSQNYSDMKFIENIEDLLTLKNKYKFVGVDNIPGSKLINTYKYVPNTLFIFGEENSGLTPQMIKLCDDVIHVEMSGSIRSFNCGTTCGIVAFDFVYRMQDNY